MAFSNADRSGFSFAISVLHKFWAVQIGWDRRIQPRRFLLLLPPQGAERFALAVHIYCRVHALLTVA
jgi:hypothetical protein